MKHWTFSFYSHVLVDDIKCVLGNEKTSLITIFLCWKFMLTVLQMVFKTLTIQKVEIIYNNYNNFVAQFSSISKLHTNYSIRKILGSVQTVRCFRPLNNNHGFIGCLLCHYLGTSKCQHPFSQVNETDVVKHQGN